MTELLKAFTSGLSKFALTWLVPSGSFLLGVYWLLVQKWQRDGLVPPWPQLSGFEAAGLFAVAAVILTLVFSLASLPLYRLLEGYSLPRKVSIAWTRKQLRRKRRLALLSERVKPFPGMRIRYSLYSEQLAAYPSSDDLVLPTRLGNAYKALESYGYDQFGLDSQSLWYELQSVASDRLRQDAEETRASVDFFVSLLAYLAAFGLLAIGTVATHFDAFIAAAGVSALALSRWAYMCAVRNAGEWRSAVQALVHVNRTALAGALGYTIPPTMEEERTLWRAWSAMANRDRRWLATLNPWRLTSPPPPTTTGRS